MDAAKRNIADSEVTQISTETRFDAAYKAVMQAAFVALMANGFRRDTSRPGHHATVVQSLPVTIGLSSQRMIVLDAFRRKRNLTDYSVGWVVRARWEAALPKAKAPLVDMEKWLAENRPNLV